MTDSAFKLVDDLTPWRLTDFEILLNPKTPYEIVATNPGQFYYHQRATNTSDAAANIAFSIKRPCQFMTQTNGTGQPIHAYVQLATDAANTWRDWTPQSSNIAWQNADVNAVTCDKKTTAGPQGSGTITPNNVPAGAKVWVTVHLDYALKGLPAPTSNFGTPPVLYKPFESTITSAGGGSYSSESLLGRGKKVTVIYGRTNNKLDGSILTNVWVRLTQSGKSALTKTDAFGNYVFYDGQLCSGDGLAGCTNVTTGAWAFANGTTPATLEVLGDGASAAAGPTYPTGFTSYSITGGGTIWVNPSTGLPTYTFSVAKNSAYSRNWKFTP